MRRFWFAVSALFLSAAAWGQNFRPFPVDWTQPADSPASVAFLLQKPAGKTGFVRIENGHLADGTGQRFRIWGVNMTGAACFPEKEQADRIAAHLARCGLNCVRFHFLDNPSPGGLIDSKRTDTRSLHPDMLDRLDFFIAKLKEHGVYADLNLNVGRRYKTGDGVADCELLGFAKALTYFDPRLIELQKEYARQLLTHRNAYTGNEYRQEPAVAVVEFVNENSIVESWFSGHLLGKHQQKNPGTWTDITESYERQLTAIFNRWLAERVPAEVVARIRAEAKTPSGPTARLTPADFKNASPERFRTELSFYMELERNFFDDMAKFLRGELGVKPLLIGSSDHNHGRSGYPHLTANARLDVVDGHVYWEHPNYITLPGSSRHTGFTIPNTPMVNAPGKSSVVQLSRTATAGKPYTVSEVNHPFPAEHACEGIPILAAYAALQDWDGIFWYTLAHWPVSDVKNHAAGHFDLSPDPMKMSQLAAGALLFLRADVRPAAKTFERSYSAEQVLDSLRMPYADSPLFTPGLPPTLPLVHAMRIGSLSGQTTKDFPPAPQEPIRSDTGQIAWHRAAEKRGEVVVDADRSQSLIGFCSKNADLATKNLKASLQTPFAALTLSALDDRPIERSSRLLLTVGGRAANAGMEWNEKRTTLEKWGNTPVQIEPIEGAATLVNLKDAKAVIYRPLDGVGRPLAEAAPAQKTAAGWSIRLGDPVTTWFVIDVAR